MFALLAVGELIGDKLPKTPNRTAALPADWRASALVAWLGRLLPPV